MSHTVAILGASARPDRYAYQAFQLLREKGYLVRLIHPSLAEIEGVAVVPTLAEAGPVETLTLYVGAERLGPMIAEIIEARPGRVIFNPGTESTALQDALTEAQIPWMEACTLVLLHTGSF